MNNFNKSLLSLALTATLAITSAQTMATELYPSFTINSADLPSGTPMPINNLGGSYSEIVSLDTTTGIFAASVIWEQTAVHNYLVGGGGTVQPTTTSQQLWLNNQFNGTFTPGNPISFTLNGTGLGVNVYYSTLGTAITIAPPTSGTSYWATNLSTGTLIATGLTYSGTGSGSTTQTNLLNGSFNLVTALSTAPGQSYFTNPTPFYNTSYQAGQFDYLNYVNTATLVAPEGPFNIGDTIVTYSSEGTANIIFNNIPEPGSLALVGLGLLGLGVVRRKKQSKKNNLTHL